MADYRGRCHEHVTCTGVVVVCILVLGALIGSLMRAMMFRNMMY